MEIKCEVNGVLGKKLVGKQVLYAACPYQKCSEGDTLCSLNEGECKHQIMEGKENAK